AMSALRLQDERTLDFAAAEARQRRVGGGERQDLDHRRDHGRFRLGEKALAVGAREIRDRDDLALPPEQLVRKARDVAHVNPGATARSAAGTSAPTGAKMIAASSAAGGI